MLTVKDIADIYKEMDSLAVRYKGEYEMLLSELYKNAASLKYSSGGTIYPAGKYFWGESRLYRKMVKKSPGRFRKGADEANYIYSFSEDGRLLAFDKRYEPGTDGETGFFVCKGEKIYFLVFGDDSFHMLKDMGIIENKNGCRVMCQCNVPHYRNERCAYLDITVIDCENDNEYFYSLVRVFFEQKYDPLSEEEYPEYSALNKQA